MTTERRPLEELYDFDEMAAKALKRLTKKWQQITDPELQPALLMMATERYPFLGPVDWQVNGSNEDGWIIEWRLP